MLDQKIRGKGHELCMRISQSLGLERNSKEGIYLLFLPLNLERSVWLSNHVIANLCCLSLEDTLAWDTGRMALALLGACPHWPGFRVILCYTLKWCRRLGPPKETSGN